MRRTWRRISKKEGGWSEETEKTGSTLGGGEEAVETRSAMFPLCGFACRRGSTRAREKDRGRKRGEENVFSEKERSPLTKPK